MKFLYSHRTRSADGQYVHIRELTDALAARGHDIIMDGPGGAARHDKKMDAGGGRLRGFVPRALYEWAELGYCAPAYWRLRARYKRAAPDILYQRYNLFYYPGVWLKRAQGVPLILEVNAPLAEERAAGAQRFCQNLRASDLARCRRGVAGERCACRLCPRGRRRR